MTLDTAIKFTTKLDGSALDQLKRQLQSLSQQGGITKQNLGQANIEINRMAREAGNTTNGLRTHVAALKNLRDNVDINSNAYKRLGNEVKNLEAKLQSLDRVAKPNVGREAIGAAAGSLALGGGVGGALGAGAGVLASTGPAGMAVAAGLAVTGTVGKASFDAAKGLDDQQRKLATLTTGSAQLTSAIQSLVSEQGYLTNSTEAASAAYEILSSGYSKQSDVLSILKASTLGAVGGFSDIKTVADAATTILNSFGLSADKTDQIIDGMIQTQNDGKIVVSQYADQIAKVASIAAAAGLSVEEMNASVGAITATGVKADSAMSGLRQALINVIKPTDQARDLAKQIGLQFNLAAIQTKGWAGFLKDVTDKTKGSSDALSVLFGDIDGYNAILKLTGPNIATFNKFLDNQTRNALAAAKAAEVAVDPFKQFDNATKDFSVTIGKLFLPMITQMVTKITQFIKLSQSPEFKDFIKNANSYMPQFEGRESSFISGGYLQKPFIETPQSGLVLDTKTGIIGPQPKQPAPKNNLIGPPVPARLQKPAPRPQLKAKGAGTVDTAMANLVNQLRDGGGGGDEEARRQSEIKYQQQVNANQADANAKQLQALRSINDAKAQINQLELTRTKINESEVNQLILTQKFTLSKLEYEKDSIAAALDYANAKAKAQTIDDASLKNLSLQSAEEKRNNDLEKLQLDLKNKQNALTGDSISDAKKLNDEKQKYLLQLDNEIRLLGDAEQQELAIANLRKQYRRDPRALESELQDLGIRQKFGKKRSDLVEELKDKGITGKDAQQRIADLDQQQSATLRAAEATRQLKRETDNLNATDITQGVRNGVTSYLESIGTLSENIKNVTGGALQGLGDQLANFVATGKLNFTDLANSIIKDMIRIATQQAIVKPLLGVLGSIFPGAPPAAGGGLPGFGMDSIIPGMGLGNTPAFKFANGGVMTEMGPMPLKKYARGGIATGPQMALYGEGSQNEAYVPLPDGRRIPVAMQGGGGGGATSVVVNVDAKGSNVEGDTPKGEQLGRALSQAVQQELLKQKRPGGLLS